MPEPVHQEDALRRAAHAPAVVPAQDPTRVSRPQVHAPTVPGAAMRERAINAPGTDTSTRIAQSVNSGADTVVSAAQSLPAQMAGSATAALLGGNPAELAAHAGIITQSAAQAVMHMDTGKQSVAAEAQAANERAHAEIGLATKSKDVQKTGMVADGTTWQEQYEKRDADPESEATKLALREHARQQHEESIKDLPAEEQEHARRTYEAQHGKMAATANFVRTNLQLGAANAAIGKKSIKEYSQDQTLGEEVPDDFAVAGHVLSRDDRVQGSTTDKVGAFFSSMSRSSARPLGNTATLTEQESRHHDDLQGKLDFLRGQAKDDLEARKQLPGGYHPEEAARKEELKSTISGLQEKASAARSAHASLGGAWHSFSESEQSEYDAHGKTIKTLDDRVEARRMIDMDKHQNTMDDIDSLAKFNQSGRERHGWLSMTPGAYKFTAEEQASHDRISRNIDRLKERGAAKPLGKFERTSLENYQRMRSDLEVQRDTGMTPEMAKARAAAQASHAELKHNKSAGMTDDERTARANAQAAREEMQTTLKTGLGKDDRDALAAAQAEREEQRTVKKTGLSKDDRDVKSELKRQQKQVYKDAASKEDFLARHEGHEVREVNGTMRAGGLNATGKLTGQEAQSTWGGMFAQAGRWLGEKTAFLGQLIKGSSSAAKAHLDAGDLGAAAAISSVGATKESLALASGPGAGHAKHFVEGIGQGTEGLGRAIADVSDEGAKGEDLADAQKAINTGGRAEEVKSGAVAWTGAAEEKQSSLGSKLGKDAWKMVKGAGTSYLATDQGSAQLESAEKSAKAYVGMNPNPAAPTTTLGKVKDKAETAATAAVKSNADDLLAASGAASTAKSAYKALAGSGSKGPKATDSQMSAFENRYARRTPELAAALDSKANKAAFAELPGQEAVATDEELQARKASAKAASVAGQERKEEARYAARQAPAAEPEESIWSSMSRGLGSVASRVKGFFGF